MIEKILFTWAGKTDLISSLNSNEKAQPGPILQALNDSKTGAYNFVYIFWFVRGKALSDKLKSAGKKYDEWAADKNHKKTAYEYFNQLSDKTDKDNFLRYYLNTAEASQSYEKWLEAKLKENKSDLKIEIKQVKLENADDSNGIYKTVSEKLKTVDEPSDVTFHLSPGTTAMGFVFTLIALSSSRKNKIKLLAISDPSVGPRYLEPPFKVNVEYVAEPITEEIRLKISGLADEKEFDKIICKSQEMHRCIDEAKLWSLHDENVLVMGETGTGKELFAKAIHRAGPRTEKPFIPLNCAALPESLIESELFGYEKNAFTGAKQLKKGAFEKADDGTLFLDEIGDMPQSVQVKVLRAIQEKEIYRIGGEKPIKVNVRIIAATNKNLMEEVAVGRFREDLLYRINCGIIKIPALRDRGEEDLKDLVNYCLESINEAYETNKEWKRKKDISIGGWNLILTGYNWPGNFRELRSVLARASVYPHKTMIDEDDIRKSIDIGKVHKKNTDDDSAWPELTDAGIELKSVLDDVKKHYVEKALEITGNKPVRAAKLLNVNRATFNAYKKL